MAKKCFICGRGPHASFSRSHSMIASKRRQHLNLQTTTIKGKKVKICNRCLKASKKKK